MSLFLIEVGTGATGCLHTLDDVHEQGLEFIDRSRNPACGDAVTRGVVEAASEDEIAAMLPSWAADSIRISPVAKLSPDTLDELLGTEAA